MTEPALVVSQSGGLTPGLSALAATRASTVASTLVTDRPEDGEYYLSPATVEEITRRTAAMEAKPLVIVDGTPHIGQLVDLQTQLQHGSVIDKRQVVWERLAETNPVAATRRELRAARLRRRRAENSQMDASVSAPSGTSGVVADSEARVQTLRDQLSQQQAAARSHIRTAYAGVDAEVVVLGGINSDTAALWAALTGEEPATGAGRPSQAVTARATVGPHTLAVTAGPGVPSSDGLPQWFREVVPGLVTALEQARCVLGVGAHADALLETVGEQFDVPCRLLSGPDAAAARRLVADILPSTTCAIQLPYTDDAHALVSELHSDTVVHEATYDDAIYLRLEVAQTALAEIRRQVTAADGELKRLDANGDTPA